MTEAPNPAAPNPAAPAATNAAPNPAAPNPAAAPEPKPAAPAGDPQPSTPTIVNTDPAKTPSAPPTWPEDWRTKLGGDEKGAKALERFGSPEDLAKAYKALETKLSSGEFKKPLPDNATPEQLNAWRKENGIPETADKYEVKLNDGLVIGEQDKPYVNKFLEGMHAKNATPDQVNAALNAYYDIVQGMTVEKLSTYETARDKTAEALQAEWGNDYKRNVNIVQSFVDSMPEGSGKHILEGFGADGIPLMSNPNIVRSVLAWAKQVNPALTVQLPGGQSDMKSLESRKIELTKMQGDRGSAYWVGPQAQQLQAEWRDIDRALSTMKTKAA